MTKPYEIEVFRTGTHVSSDGRKIPFTRDDVDEAIKNYNVDNFRVPLIVSHETGDYSDRSIVNSELAFGIVDKFRRVGDRVYAQLQKIAPEFVRWVEEGRLHSISSSFYLPDSPHNPNPGQLSFRHIAALGKNPPAVKGLTPLVLKECAVFSEGDEHKGTVNFMMAFPASPMKIAAALLRNVRDWVIDSTDLEKAETLMPSEWLMQLEGQSEREYAPLELAMQMYQELSALQAKVYEMCNGGSDNDDLPLYPVYSQQEGAMAKTYTNSMNTLLTEARIENLAQFMRALEIPDDQEHQAEAYMTGKAPLPAEKRKLMAKAMGMSDTDLQKRIISDDEIEMQERMAALQAQFDEINARNEALQREVIEQRTNARKADISSFLEGLRREGKITAGIVRAQSVEYGEGQKRTFDLVSFMASLPDDQMAYLKSIFSNLPQQVVYQEIVPSGSFEEEGISGAEQMDFVEVGNLARKMVNEAKSRGEDLSEAKAVDLVLQQHGIRL